MRNESKIHKDLDVWNKAMDFTEQLLCLAKHFQKKNN